MKKLSVVVCVYNEEGNIKPLVDAIHKELDGIEYEIVYVDDGSRDNTIREIKELNDPSIILVEFQKNYGQSSALAAGIDIATGEFIATIDGDLQNDPADIPAMIKMAEEGDFDMVAGIRANRQDNIIRKIPSKIANFFIRVTTGVKMKDYGCTLKVFRSKTAKSIGLYGELHRFIPVLVNLEGGSIAQKEVLHHPRIRGHSKYGMGRTLKVVSDLLLMLFFKKYMRKPMHLFGTLGILLFSGGVVIDMYMLILKILGNDIWGKPLLLLGILLTLAGIQLITFGLIAEMVTRTYYESQKKKPYNIKRISGGQTENSGMDQGSR